MKELPKIDLPEEWLIGTGVNKALLSLYTNFPCRLKSEIFVLCMEGEIEASVNLNRITVRANDFVTIMPGSILQIHSVNGEPMLYFVSFKSLISTYLSTTCVYKNALRNKPATRMHQTKKYHRKKSVRAANCDIKVAKILVILRFRLRYFHSLLFVLMRKMVVGFYSFLSYNLASLLFPFISYQRKTKQQYRMVRV